MNANIWIIIQLHVINIDIGFDWIVKWCVYDVAVIGDGNRGWRNAVYRTWIGTSKFVKLFLSEYSGMRLFDESVVWPLFALRLILNSLLLLLLCMGLLLLLLLWFWCWWWLWWLCILLLLMLLCWCCCWCDICVCISRSA